MVLLLLILVLLLPPPLLLLMPLCLCTIAGHHLLIAGVVAAAAARAASRCGSCSLFSCWPLHHRGELALPSALPWRSRGRRRCQHAVCRAAPCHPPLMAGLVAKPCESLRTRLGPASPQRSQQVDIGLLWRSSATRCGVSPRLRRGEWCLMLVSCHRASSVRRPSLPRCSLLLGLSTT